MADRSKLTVTSAPGRRRIWRGPATGSFCVAAAFLLAVTGPASAFYFRPVFAAPRPIMMPAFRPVQPMIMPAFRPAIRPIVRLPQPAFRPAIGPVARPIPQPVYRPSSVPSPRVAQPKALPAAQSTVTTIVPGNPSGSPKSSPATNAPATSAPATVKVTQPQQPATVTTIVPGPEKSSPTTNVPAPVAAAIVKPVQPIQPTMVTTNAQSTPAVAQKPGSTANVANAAIATSNAMTQVLQSRPGQVLTATLAAAGGEAATKLTPLGYAADAANIANAYVTAPNKTDGLIAAGSQLSGDVAVDIAGKLGGPLAAAGMQAAVTAGDLYVAPALGGAIFKADPGLFTPASQANVNILAAPGGGAPLTAQQMNSLLSLN